MDTDAYQDKVIILLKVEKVYRKLKKDHTVSSERKMNSMLINFKKKSLFRKIYTNAHFCHEAHTTVL